MSTLAESLARARATGDFNELVNAIPFARFAGLEVVRENGKMLGKLRESPHLIGNPMLPAIHGGAIGALLESTAIFHVIFEVEQTPKIIGITVEYLRSARPVVTWARAEMVRQGRRVATVRCVAWQEDPAKPVAAANVQLLLPSTG